MNESTEQGFVFSNQKQSLSANGNNNGFIIMNNSSSSNSSFVQSGKNSDNISGKNSEVQMRTESISKTLNLSPEFILQLQNGDAGRDANPPLGLKLTLNPSFLSDLDKMRLCSSTKEKKRTREANEGVSSSSHERSRPKLDNDKDKLKAGNIPALLIKIGTWQRIARHEGDLVIKLYYAKRKLVWELLEGPLKSKIEIQWDDICAIRATMLEDEPGVLEIELIQAPVYYRETSPQPRKHTLWQQSSDFTGGQAPIWRRHHVTFPPGMLDRNYKKLLQCDKRLNELSKKPYPSHESPYFDPTLFGTTLNFSRYGANKAAQFPYRTYPAMIPREPLFRATPNPSLPVMNVPLTYQGGGDYNFAAPNQATWQQSISIPTNNFGIQGAFGIPTTTNNNNVCNPSYYKPNVWVSTTNPSSSMSEPSGFFTDIQTDLLDSVQFDDALLESVGSMSSLLEPMGVNNNNNINEASYQLDMAFNAINGDQGSSNNNYGLDGMTSPIHWLATQCSSDEVFQGASESLFQSSSENLFRCASENIFEFAGNNLMMNIGGNNLMNHGGNNAMNVGGNNGMNIGGNNLMNHGGNNAMNVGGNNGMNIGGNNAMNVGGNNGMNVGDNKMNPGGNNAMNVGSNNSMNPGGNNAMNIGGNNPMMNVCGNNAMNIGGNNPMMNGGGNNPMNPGGNAMNIGGNNSMMNVGGNNQMNPGGNNPMMNVGGNNPMNPGGNNAVNVGGNNSMMNVGGNNPMNPGGNNAMKVCGNNPMNPGGNNAMNVGGNNPMNVGGNNSMNPGGNNPMNVGGNNSMMNFSGNNPMNNFFDLNPY